MSSLIHSWIWSDGSVTRVYYEEGDYPIRIEAEDPNEEVVLDLPMTPNAASNMVEALSKALNAWFDDNERIEE